MVGNPVDQNCLAADFLQNARHVGEQTLSQRCVAQKRSAASCAEDDMQDDTGQRLWYGFLSWFSGALATGLGRQFVFATAAKSPQSGTDNDDRQDGTERGCPKSNRPLPQRHGAKGPIQASPGQSESRQSRESAALGSTRLCTDQSPEGVRQPCGVVTAWSGRVRFVAVQRGAIIPSVEFAIALESSTTMSRGHPSANCQRELIPLIR